MLGIHTGRPPRWRLSSRLTIAGALIICGCENDPLAIPIPGSAWTLQDTVLRAMETGSIAKTQAQGSSATLYVGRTPDDVPREVRSLLLPPRPDALVTSARLTLFRRTFGDEGEDPDQSFALYTIDALTTSDTAWHESDTSRQVGDFTLTQAGMTTMTRDSTYSLGDTVEVTDEHLSFKLDSLFLKNWRDSTQANHGFLVQIDGGSGLYSFHSRSGSKLPYLELITVGEDTTTTDYVELEQDLSIFPVDRSWENNDAELIHLNFSEGIRSYIDFSSAFQFDSTDIISSGRLILYQNRLATSSAASPISVVLSRYSGPGRDSTVALTVVPTYDPAQSDSIVIPLLPLLRDYAAGDANFGIELSLLPASNDFDHIYFWGPGPATPDSAYWPRLEIIYTPDVFGSP